MFRKPIIALAIFLTLLLPGVAYATGVTLGLGEVTAATGSNVGYFGSALAGSLVPVKVIDNSGEIIFYDEVSADANGTFSGNFVIPGIEAGVVTVVAGYGNDVSVQNLTVTRARQNSSSDSQHISTSSGSTTVSPSSGGTVSLNNEAMLSIPPGAIQSAFPVPVSVKKVTTPAVPSGFRVLSTTYRFSVDKQDHFSFSKPVTLTFNFDPSRLAPEEKPAVYYYDDNKGQWINIGGTVLGNTISVTVNHFTIFTVMAEESQSFHMRIMDICGHWAEKSIEKLMAIKALTGYPDGTFKPDKVITRAEFVTVLVKAFKLAPERGRVFSDTADHWAGGDIATAMANGIISGYSEKRFGPDDPVTREQMAVMTVKAAKLSLGGQVSFADAGDIPDWAKDFVTAAVQKGLMKGYPGNTFRPGDKATRAEAVTVVVNALK